MKEASIFNNSCPGSSDGTTSPCAANTRFWIRVSSCCVTWCVCVVNMVRDTESKENCFNWSAS